jgi:hypothetical protein
LQPDRAPEEGATRPNACPGHAVRRFHLLLIQEGHIMLSGVRTTIAIAALVLLPLVAEAQDPAPHPMPSDSGRSRPEHPMDRQGRQMGPEDSRRNGMEPRMRPMMDDARLDSLVTAMHGATGTKKMAAMERVIDALIADRRTMHEHMMQMMRGRGGEGERSCMPGGPGCPMRDSAGSDRHS